MLISHRYRFIFLHNRKAAGSSVTAFLNRLMGPNDLQVGIWRDAIRYGGRYNRRIVRETLSRDGLRAAGYYARKLRAPRPSRFVERVQEYKYAPILHTTNIAHPTAAAVRDAFPHEWETYWKFCVVRDPYGKAVSDYYWMTRKLPRGQVTFTEFLKRIADPKRPDPERVVPNPPTNWPLYTIDDEIVADRICRYTYLEADLVRVLREIGVDDLEGSLPRAKNAANKKSERAYEWKNEDIDLAKLIYRQELTGHDESLF